MKTSAFFLMILCLFCSRGLFAGELVAIDSCRTSLNDGSVSEADENKSDSNKLSVRGDNKAAKSWIKFDISGLDVDSLAECKLRIALYSPKTSTCLLSVVNDDCTTNIGWTKSDLTWNTAPGNYVSSDGVNADQAGVTVDQLQDDLDSSLTTLIDTVDYSYGGQPGDQFSFDVLPYLQADTDGIVQFVLHGAGGSTDFATHDTSEGATYWPTLVYSTVPQGTCPDVGILYNTYADVSCRTSLYDGSASEANDNKTDSSKLSVRGDEKAAKSWIKFDLNDLNLDPNSLKAATLRITLYEPKSSTCQLSAVNDNCLDNIDWGETTLTWNNAPGNYTSSDGVNADMAGITPEQLQDDLNPDKTTTIGMVDYSYGGMPGDQFEFDVLSILQADTDGIVQFILHDAGGSSNFATHDTSAGEDFWPRLQILQGPAGADNPYPCPGQVVSTDLVGLSWTNPDPNDTISDITCTVYLGTDPNRTEMDSIELDPGAESVLINPENFTNYGNLQNRQQYYWVVDCYDPSARTIPGMMWDFYVNNNDAPVVSAGLDQDAWLGMSGTPGQEVIQLDGTTSDDGLPNPPATYTVLWTQVDTGAPTVAITPDDQDDASVTITQRGDYEFMLTADDGEKAASESVRIVVGDNPCDASHISTGDDYDPGDVNRDCIVNLQDFAELLAANWLDCSDMLTNCGN